MIRRTIIVLLALSAGVTGAISVAFCVKRYPPPISLVSDGPTTTFVPVSEWGRGGSYMAFYRKLRHCESRRNIRIDRPGFAMTVDEYQVDIVMSIWIPLTLTILLAAYPTTAFLCGPFRHWRRRRKGLCVKCGYDLRGNVTGRCPECGGLI
ncbi:MAG: hypothetical protein PVI86_05800 [Phycisphaerae bacterium]|jgi:hypothetical protein